jgi:hypothetical protein
MGKKRDRLGTGGLRGGRKREMVDGDRSRPSPFRSCTSWRAHQEGAVRIESKSNAMLVDRRLKNDKRPDLLEKLAKAV